MSRGGNASSIAYSSTSRHSPRQHAAKGIKRAAPRRQERLAHKQPNMLYYGWQERNYKVSAVYTRKASQGISLGGFSIPILRAGPNAQARCLSLSRQAICKGSGRLPQPRRREGTELQNFPQAIHLLPVPGWRRQRTKYNTLVHKIKHIDRCKKSPKITSSVGYRYSITGKIPCFFPNWRFI